MFGICDENGKRLAKSESAQLYTDGFGGVGTNKVSAGQTQSACVRSFTFTGKDACSYDLEGIIKPLARFSGVIEIVGGLILCFVGGKSVLWCATILSGVLIAGVIFALAFNFGLMNSMLGGSIAIVIVVGVVAVLVGAIAAFFIRKFLKNYFVMIIGGACGAIVVVLLTAPFTIPNFVKIIIAIIGMILGACLGRKLNKVVAAAGTAIMGSFFIFHGISSFAGGFPSIMMGGDIDQKFDAMFFGYVAGMIVFAIAGTIVQWKYFPVETSAQEEEKKNVMNQ